jgi:hypothetical protein
MGGKFEVGDTVRHKLSNEVYRILKVSEAVAVCQCPPYCDKFAWEWYVWDRYICAMENLEPHPAGQEIFEWLDNFSKSFFIDFKGMEWTNKYEHLLKPVEPGTQLKLI